ncbi:MAG: glutathione synthase [Myxococcota bacterium]
MRSLFVMDPLSRIVVTGDSTYVVMRECTDRGFDVLMCTPDALFAANGRAYARAVPVKTGAAEPWFAVGDETVIELGDVDVVWMRKDPPFDMTYIFTTYLLDMAPPSTLVVNDPKGLKLFNEKMWVQQRWPEFQPETRIANRVADLVQFVRERKGKSVLKPWDGNGGRGVVITHADDRNLPSIAELLSGEGQHYVIAQAFIPEVEQGDKRILLFDGEPVAGMMRIPLPEDHRANMHAGARVEATELSERDLEICAALSPELKRHEQVFVGIDVINGFLTEINVTSPTGIQELNRLFDRKLEADLVDVVMAKAEARRAS